MRFGIGNTQYAVRNWQVALCLAVYASVGLGLAVLLRGLRFDDPYITYRYAENLALGRGFVFNPGEATLITTAPLYAVILALARVLGADIPGASFVIGVVALVVAALALFMLGRRRERARAGFVAGLVLLLSPLAWLTVGFETPLFLAVALLALLAADVRRPVLAGLCASIALGLRGDGFVVLAVVALASLDIKDCRIQLPSLKSPAYAARLIARRLIAPATVVIVAVLVYAPLALWLTAQFGTPLPSTLQTKSAQAVSGLTGFYPNTNYVEGALLLARAYLAQSPLYALVLLAGLAGVARLIHALWRVQSCRGLFLAVLAWMAAHFAGYAVLGVAPYPWYYAPMLPGLACLVAMGFEWLRIPSPAKASPSSSGNSSAASRSLAYAVYLVPLALCLAPLIAGDVAMGNVLHGATPPPPSDVAAKVLPETKVDVYERVGRWLRDTTPADATVGVTELGVISYYSGRNTVDFLGLTQPNHLAAIRHGDFLQALIREQPDYVALTSVNAIYDVDPQHDAWFTALYTSVASFDDARFWGAPMTVWQRMQPRVPISVMLDATPRDLGDGWQVTSVMASAREVIAGEPLFLRLRLQAGPIAGAANEIRTLRVQPVLIAGGDGLPVVSRLIFTSRWRTGESDWLDVPVMPQPDPRPGGYVVTANWMDGTSGASLVKAGTLKVDLDIPAEPSAPVVDLSRGVGVELVAQPLSACLGAALPITVTWRGGSMADPGTGLAADYTAFVHVRDAANHTLAQADGPPRNSTYPTSVWSPGERIPDPHVLTLLADIAPGTYDLVVGLYDPVDNLRWPVDPSPPRTPDGGVRIAQVVVMRCR
jgi:hypothetical protein